MTSSVQLTPREFRSLKDHILSIIPGTDLNNPNIIEMELREHPLVSSVFKDQLYDSGNTGTVVGYLELTVDTVGDLMRFLSKGYEGFILINAEPEFKKEGWKYLRHSTNVNISVEVPGLVLREHSQGYVLTYGISEDTWRNEIKKLHRRNREVIQCWSLWCAKAKPIQYMDKSVGLIMENGIKVRFDYPGMFAALTKPNDEIDHFLTPEEFFDYIGKTYF